MPLVIAPDPRLAICSAEVTKVDDKIRKLMDDMLETMYHEAGIGLAAVQVGVHKRILVMDLADRSGRYKKDSDGDGVPESKPIFMVNPEIAWESEEENMYDEGCLSFPDQRASVIRPKQVHVKYLDYYGKPQILECDELLATCVQHEIDHLNGVVFIDHVSKLKADMIMRKMKKLKKLQQ
jgi:peptide deformylase